MEIKMTTSRDLKIIGNNIWTMEGDMVRMFGIPFTTRMTIVRLSNGMLWLHSPIMPNSKRCTLVESLGKISYLIAPNKIHSLGIEPWKKRYPGFFRIS